MITSWFRFSGLVFLGLTSTAQAFPPLMQKKSGQPRFVAVHPLACNSLKHSASALLAGSFTPETSPATPEAPTL